MWHETEIKNRLGISYPIVQGPFGGGASSSRLTATVSNAGGLGSYGVHTFTPQQITATAGDIRELTNKPFALNLWIPKPGVPQPSEEDYERSFARLDPYYRELGIARPPRPNSFEQDFAAQVRAVLDARPAVFSFVFGIPDPSILLECRAHDITTLGTATTPDEAVALDAAGVDCIVASGFEAGGHRGAFLRPAEDSLIGTFALIPQVVDRVKVPVIAAGGIGDARGIRAALALGAQGVQIGTAFLACEESNASQSHRELLFDQSARDTVLSKAFTGRLARSIRNRFSDDMEAHEDELLPFPIQLWLAGTLKAASVAQGRTDLVSLSAGQAAALLHKRSAKALFDELVFSMS
ncbi:nitronate monooxygenase [Bradyrhizobium sp. 2]|uniref:NAD(P)H-dependent flavin oxidoreductase n=1 Tax=unclassified Bradyrhizobium TaxID=2631580 RepID=UPI001FF94573|nr:nitronate monooxygenase [Bradyrhizobium sp. 48]MCK1465533.1 nitronate monooxygenase [Bradyrhizobium sp. 2]